MLETVQDIDPFSTHNRAVGKQRKTKDQSEEDGGGGGVKQIVNRSVMEEIMEDGVGLAGVLFVNSFIACVLGT